MSARSAEEPKKRRVQTYPKNSGEHVGEFNQAYNLEYHNLYNFYSGKFLIIFFSYENFWKFSSLSVSHGAECKTEFETVNDRKKSAENSVAP